MAAWTQGEEAAVGAGVDEAVVDLAPSHVGHSQSLQEAEEAGPECGVCGEGIASTLQVAGRRLHVPFERRNRGEGVV